MSEPFRRTFIATPAHIDELGHVNNAVWVQWIQDMATAHWQAVADPAHVEAYIWVVIRHEIDYKGNIVAGESVVGRTWIPGTPKGARFARNAEFIGDDGKIKVQALTWWAMIDRLAQRPARVTREIAAPFVKD